MKRILLLLVISNLVYGQDFKTVPDVFDKQCKTSFIKSIESETISLDNLKSRSQRYWIVYSDRDDNSFYSNHHSNSTNNKNASFMQGFYVKNTSGGWLHLVDVLDEIDYGWIHSKNLLLSIYSLKTEGDIEKGTVSIPRKSVILTSIEEARNVGGVLQTQKRYYLNPSRAKRYEDGFPRSFQPLFVFKETGTSVLLGGSDVLDGSVETNKSKIYGWINVSDKTDWDTRVALEDAQSSVALEEYSSSKLNGYITQNEITTCVEENLCDSKKSIAQFSVGPTRNNVMRRPVIQNIDHNIKKVISVAKDNKGNKVYEALLTEARRLQSNVNIVFVLDATASMRPYYKSIANSLEKVINNNQKIIKSNLKLGVVVYRDYADGKSAYDVQPLTTDFNKVKKVINSTVCQSKDKDLPEAQFNGLINGIEEVGFNADESNIIVLIGDCGNHVDDKNGYALNNIIDLYGKYKTNLISFQVKSGADNSFYTFNEDVMDVIFEVANKKIEGKGSDLKIKLESNNNNTIKLKMIKGDEPDYENMFGLLVYSGNEPSSPKLLESTIENTLKEYMLSISNNINILENYVRTGGPTGSEPPEGLIIYMMDVLKCSREEAKDHLRKTEFTVQAYVAIDYFGNGVESQVPVVLLTEGEKNNLVKSLRKLTEGVYASAELKKVFQDNIIYICKSIIGQNTSTETIENLSLNQIWNIILGVDFGNKNMKDKKLNELTAMKKKDFKRFYKDFEMVAKEFCDESYVHTDPLINRRFDIGGSYLFWVPLDDLPGCKIN
jgi:hypothetical protein